MPHADHSGACPKAFTEALTTHATQMLVFYSYSSSRGGSGWRVGPLLLLVPFLLNSGLLEVAAHVLFNLFAGVGRALRG